MKKRLVAMVSMMLVGAMVLTGCGSSETTTGDTSSAAQSSTVVTVGSTTVTPIMEKIAAEYQGVNPDVVIEVQGIGSSAGVKAAVEQTANIGMTSRELTEEEKQNGLTEIVVARDGIAMAVHPSNPIQDITAEHIRGIYEGAITNWSEIGGADADIIVVAREDGSGTREAFQEILNLEITQRALIGEGNGAVKANVATKENAIGFVSIGYLDDTIKAITVDGVEATVENIQQDTYTIQRPLLLLTQPEVNDLTQAVLDFSLSAEGQEVVAEQGYIPVN